MKLEISERYLKVKSENTNRLEEATIRTEERCEDLHKLE